MINRVLRFPGVRVGMVILSLLLQPLAMATPKDSEVTLSDQKTPDRVTATLVILGDSISAGYGLAKGTGWVDLLAQRFEQENIAIKVINESISGEVSAGGLARLPGIIKRLKPSWVVIELGGNDGLRGMSPKVMAKNLTAMIELCEQNGIEPFLFGMKLPPNYGKAYTRMFEKVYVNVAEQKSVPLLPFFLEGVGGFETLMQDDRIHPNAQAQQQLLTNAWEFLARHLFETPLH